MITQKDLHSILEIFKKNNPNPRSELTYVNDYTFMVAVILSAQATDKGVNKATPALFAKVKTPEAMLKLGLDGLKEYIKTIGLYNNKAKSIINLSQELVSKHNGKMPRHREDLEKLPGIGRKSANVFLNQIYNEPVIAVDTHVIRLSERLDLSDNIKPEKIEQDLEKIVPSVYKSNISNWLVLHGRYICQAKKPLCDQCPIQQYCKYYREMVK